MTSSPRLSTATVLLGMLAFAALAAALMLLLTTHRARTAIPSLVAPEVGLLVTSVPTFEVGSSLVTSPLPADTLSTSLGVQTVLDTSGQAVVPLLIPGLLVDPELSLRSGPVDVPLELQIPALNVRSPVLGVGLTLTNAMASPVGVRPDDPVWQSVFWYRGSGIPGDIGTATFAGHFDDADGRPAVFAFLGDLRIGDLIIVHDKRTELDISFIVTEMRSYTTEETDDPAVLARVFGSSTVSGAEAQPVSDQFSRLTLITCTGAWIEESFDLRLVVFATRASYPLELGE